MKPGAGLVDHLVFFCEVEDGSAEGSTEVVPGPGRVGLDETLRRRTWRLVFRHWFPRVVVTFESVDPRAGTFIAEEAFQGDACGARIGSLEVRGLELEVWAPRGQEGREELGLDVVLGALAFITKEKAASFSRVGVAVDDEEEVGVKAAC